MILDEVGNVHLDALTEPANDALYFPRRRSDAAGRGLKRPTRPLTSLLLPLTSRPPHRVCDGRTVL